MTSTAIEDTEFVVRTIATTAVENEKYFGDLDAVVGDGDFGYSLARGFEKILLDWDSFDRADPGTFLLKIAVAITSRIGGTSGPIWGTAFMRAGTQLKGEDSPTRAIVVRALRASIEGIKMRGNSDVGDKTLLDAIVPAVDALEQSIADGDDTAAALDRAAAAARRAGDATVEMLAKRGRASYSGERSIGSVDPGAIAVAMIAERIAAEWKARAL